MLYQISNGTVSVGGELILSHIDFEIRGNEKIAVVGRNGAGRRGLGTARKECGGQNEKGREF